MNSKPASDNTETKESFKSDFLITLEEQILRMSESDGVEYKGGFQWDFGSNKQLVHKIIKSILCFANKKDGGRIIIGFNETTSELDLTETQYASFDSTKINELLHKFAEPIFSCIVTKPALPGIVDASFKGKRVVIIDVPEFVTQPIICKKDFGDNKNPMLKEGMLYCRTGKSNSENKLDSVSMRDIIDRATQKNGEKLLSNIHSILLASGFSPASSISGVRDIRYDTQIQDAVERISKHLPDDNKQYGNWGIFSYPAKFNEDRISLQKATSTILDNRVILRGWDFPHAHPSGIASLKDGIIMRTAFRHHQEAFCFYSSALFVFKRELWEDHEKPFGNEVVTGLDFINAIWSITEFFLFFKRLYDQATNNEDIVIKLQLQKLNGRELLTSDPRIAWSNGYVCTEEDEFLFEKALSIAMLNASYISLANECCQKLFRLFNCTLSEEDISKWQTRLLEKRFN